MSSGSSTNSSLLPTPPAKGVGYQLSVLWEGTLPELVAQLAQAGVTVFSVTQGEPEERVKTNARDAEILAKYTADPKKYSSVKLGIEYGISRERVCQILRRSNALSYHQERRELARRDMQEEKSKVQQENKERVQALVDKASKLIAEEGLSIRTALIRMGQKPHSHLGKLVATHLTNLGHKHKWGRHRDFSERLEKVEALLLQGMTVHAIVEHLRRNGDPTIYYQWIVSRISVKELRKQKEP